MGEHPLHDDDAADDARGQNDQRNPLAVVRRSQHRANVVDLLGDQCVELNVESTESPSQRVEQSLRVHDHLVELRAGDRSGS